MAGNVEDLSPEQVKAGIENGSILLVDVREPNELAAERIPGAVDFPLSVFDPAALPDPAGKTLVFSCRSGRGSVIAWEAAQAAGLPYNKHLAGGILAWKAAGLDTEKG